MKNYIYETKCGSCGDINRRTYSEVLNCDFSEFNSEMEARSLKPQHYFCPECNNTTEQDIVFYGIDTQAMAARRYSMVPD